MSERGYAGQETMRPRESNFLVQIRVRPPLGREIEVNNFFYLYIYLFILS